MLLAQLTDIVYDRLMKPSHVSWPIPWSQVTKRERDRLIDDNNGPMLLEHIKKNGIITPILVYKKNENKYGIVDGLRRYLVYERLNEKYPGEGWDKIPIKIVFQKEPSEEELMKCIRRQQISKGPPPPFDE